MLELDPDDDDEEDPADVDDEEFESLELEPVDEAPSLLSAPPPSELDESDDFDPFRRP